MDDADIRKLIEALYTTEAKTGESGSEMARFMLAPDDSIAVEQLEAIGAEAVPYLVSALADPRTRHHYRKVSEFLDPRSPFARLCVVVISLNPPEAAAPLGSYLDHPIRGFRRLAAYTLGSIAAPACVEPLIKALADPSEQVRAYGIKGIDGAAQANEADAAFLAAIFPAIAANLELPDDLLLPDDLGCAPRLLLQIDRERAIPLLLSPRSLAIENPQLTNTLSALIAAGDPIPHSLLLPLLDRLEPIAATSPHTTQFRCALVAYALHPDAATEPKLRSLLTSRTPEITVAAAEALAAFHGLGDIFHRIREIAEQEGLDALSEPRQYYYAVRMYRNDVRNGGHVEYMGNYGPPDYQLAIAGLRAIGDPLRAAILEKALEVFGRAGPPLDRERRREIVYEKLTRRQSEFLNTLDKQHHACPKNLDLLLALYAVDHKEAFTGSFCPAC